MSAATLRPMSDVTSLIDAEDVPALLFEIDVLCGDGQWDALEELAERCRQAVERGRQLWPVASHVDYRLALEAPAVHAAAVLDRESRFTLGPLSEVCASMHTFAELKPHLPGAHIAGVVAQERVLRGEDLSRGRVPDSFELPMHLIPGEHGHLLPSYRAHDADFPDPTAPPRADDTVVTPGKEVPVVRAVESAVRDLFEVWTAQSNGTCLVAAAEGAGDAATGLLARRALSAEIGAGEALVRLTWAGSSGAMHGRRRGGASGRFHAWWAAAALSGAEWPLFADEAAETFDRIVWTWFEPIPRPGGLVFGLTATDPASGNSVAILATDSSQ